jgi:cation diffusion facilitator family transporter
VRTTGRFEFPRRLAADVARARRLAWLTLAFFASVVALLSLVVGGSQAMRAAWIEDMLALVPPAVFLVGLRLSTRPPSERFPFGWHRVVSLGHLVAALALLSFGLWLLWDGASSLLAGERPTIGAAEAFGQTVWLGWLMVPALVYSTVPAVLLGRAKTPIAERLHDKVLYADARMNRADWMTAVAALAGVLGIAVGLWWADAAAAVLISADVARDGMRHTRLAAGALMDETPRRVASAERHPLEGRIRDAVAALPWVEDVQVRLREEGHVFFGDVVVRARLDALESAEGLARGLADAEARARALDWRVHDLVVSALPPDR